MPRDLRLEFNSRIYRWFNIDEMLAVHGSHLASLFADDIQHYFQIPVQEQVLCDVDGPLAVPADLHRVLADETPYLWLFDARQHGGATEVQKALSLRETGASVASVGHFSAGLGLEFGASKGELAAAASDNVEEVVLRKSVEGEAFGFTSVPDAMTYGRPCLRITEVTPDGLLASWNDMHPLRRLRVGDRIFSVNGVRDNPAEMRSLLCGSCVTLLVDKGHALNCISGPRLLATSSREALLCGELQDRERCIRELEQQLSLWRHLAEPARSSGGLPAGDALAVAQFADAVPWPPPWSPASSCGSGVSAPSCEGDRKERVTADQKIQELHRRARAAKRGPGPPDVGRRFPISSTTTAATTAPTMAGAVATPGVPGGQVASPTAVSWQPPDRESPFALSGFASHISSAVTSRPISPAVAAEDPRRRPPNKTFPGADGASCGPSREQGASTADRGLVGGTSLLDELGKLREEQHAERRTLLRGWSASEEHHRSLWCARAELEESRRRQRRLEAERAEQALEIQGLKRRLDEQQNQQRWRSLQLAAEEAVREDEEQLEALLACAAREAKRGAPSVGTSAGKPERREEPQANLKDEAVELQHLKRDAERNNAEADGLRAAVQALQQELEESRRGREAIDELQATVQALQQELDESRRGGEEIDELQATVQVLQQELDESRRGCEEVDELQATVQALEQELEESRRGCEEVDELRAMVQALEQELDESRRGHEEVDELRAMVQALEQELDESRKVYEEVDELRATLCAREQELGRLRRGQEEEAPLPDAGEPWKAPPSHERERRASGQGRAKGAHPADRHEGPKFASLPVPQQKDSGELKSYLPNVTAALSAALSAARDTPGFGDAGVDSELTPRSAPKQEEPATEYVSKAADPLDKRLERQLRELGASSLKGHELIRTGPNKYKLGEKRIFMKLDGGGNVTVRDGSTYVALQNWVRCLEPSELLSAVT